MEGHALWIACWADSVVGWDRDRAHESGAVYIDTRDYSIGSMREFVSCQIWIQRLVAESDAKGDKVEAWGCGIDVSEHDAAGIQLDHTSIHAAKVLY
jgi:hypothetical protein